MVRDGKQPAYKMDEEMEDAYEMDGGMENSPSNCSQAQQHKNQAESGAPPYPTFQLPLRLHEPYQGQSGASPNHPTFQLPLGLYEPYQAQSDAPPDHPRCQPQPRSDEPYQAQSGAPPDHPLQPQPRSYEPYVGQYGPSPFQPFQPRAQFLHHGLVTIPALPQSRAPLQYRGLFTVPAASPVEQAGEGMGEDENTKVSPSQASSATFKAENASGLVVAAGWRPSTAPEPLPAPEPSELYLIRSSLPSDRLEYRRRLLVVLDLNGTLIHRSGSRRLSWTERPGLDLFLYYLFHHHYVMIWSSAPMHNVNWICDRLFLKTERFLTLAVWGREKLGLNDAQFRSKIQVYKKLNAIWEDPEIRAKMAELGEVWDQRNTVVIDDSAEKNRANPYSIIVVPKFTNTSNESAQNGHPDNILWQVNRYLALLAWEDDISKAIRANSFRMKN